MSEAVGSRTDRSRLLRWYRRNRRELPWRATRDPYAIWVSEVMLQQTRVSTVVPYYEAFLRRFPDVATLASAGEETVLAAWSGLGYYRRARALHRAARRIVDDHRGRVPADPVALRRLPGIGRYTAGAIASMAFSLEEPVLDGNVRRVLARRLGLRNPAEEALWRVAGELVRGSAPGELNQALMELGALVCTPHRPDCPRCPLLEQCVARGRGRPEAYPASTPRPAPEHVVVGVAIIRRGDRILLERSGPGSPLRGNWDLPAREFSGAGDPTSEVGRRIAQDHGLEFSARRALGRRKHGILHRRLTLWAFEVRLRRGRISTNPKLRWLVPEHVDTIPVSGATRKLLSLIDQ